MRSRPLLLAGRFLVCYLVVLLLIALVIAARIFVPWAFVSVLEAVAPVATPRATLPPPVPTYLPGGRRVP